MKKFIVAGLLSAVAAAMLATSLSAKGDTVKITIRGDSLAMPIDITDAATLKRLQRLGRAGRVRQRRRANRRLHH